MSDNFVRHYFEHAGSEAISQERPPGAKKLLDQDLSLPKSIFNAAAATLLIPALSDYRVLTREEGMSDAFSTVAIESRAVWQREPFNTRRRKAMEDFLRFIDRIFLSRDLR